MKERKIAPVNEREDAAPFEARIIAASSRELGPPLRERRFRKDLFYRLNVVSLTLPPLRERKPDIPLLIEHIFHGISGSYGDPLETQSHWVLSAKALDALLLYDWPGNVRELENCIKRAVILSSGQVLDASDLFPPLQVLSLSAKDDTQMRSLSLHEMERKTIIDSLLAAGGRKPLAARMLGIGITTLYRKLHDYQQSGRPHSRTQKNEAVEKNSARIIKKGS